MEVNGDTVCHPLPFLVRTMTTRWGKEPTSQPAVSWPVGQFLIRLVLPHCLSVIFSHRLPVELANSFARLVGQTKRLVKPRCGRQPLVGELASWQVRDTTPPPARTLRHIPRLLPRRTCQLSWQVAGRAFPLRSTYSGYGFFPAPS